MIFRDGQYSNARDFDLKKEINIIATFTGAASNDITIRFELLAKGENKFYIDLSNSQIEEELLKDRFCEKLNVSELPATIKISK